MPFVSFAGELTDHPSMGSFSIKYPKNLSKNAPCAPNVPFLHCVKNGGRGQTHTTYTLVLQNFLLFCFNQKDTTKSKIFQMCKNRGISKTLRKNNESLIHSRALTQGVKLKDGSFAGNHRMADETRPSLLN